MEASVRLVFIGVTFLATLFALSKRGDLFVLIFIVLAPLNYFSFNVGVVLSPAKLIGIMALVYVIVWRDAQAVFGNHYIVPFILFIVYGVCITLLMSIAWPDISVEQQGFFYSSSMRGLVQIFQQLMGISIVFLLVSRVIHPITLYRVQVVMLAVSALICIYGLYVWYAQQVGLPFNPITRQGGTGSQLDHVIYSLVDGQVLVRAYSLTGEPKALAIFCCMGIVLSHFTVGRNWCLFRGTAGGAVLTGLFLITLYLTLSTAGYLILPILLATAAYLYFVTGLLSGGVAIRLVTFVVLAVGLATMMAGSPISEKLVPVLETRVSERLETQGLFTYAETSILRLWSDRPELLVTGVGLGGSSFYVRLYDASSYAGFTAAPRGIIGFVSDQGIIGLALFLFAFAQAARPIMAAARLPGPYRQVYAGILVVCAAKLVLLMTYSLWYVQWLTIGLLVASARLAEQELVMSLHARREQAFPPPGSASRGLNHPRSLSGQTRRAQ